MATPDRREILNRVASGALSPQEGAARLEELASSDSSDAPSIQRVRIDRQLGSVEVIGDSGVREAVAEGRHQARIDGETMLITSDPDYDHGGRYHEHGGPFLLGFGLGRHFSGEPLIVRMNPALALDLKVQAGSCKVSGVTGPIDAVVQAGSATIEGFQSPLALDVQAGSVRATGCLRDGESKINCEAGSVTLHLERGSSVRVSAASALGKVTLPNSSSVVAGRLSRDVVIGDGRGTLHIETSMGSVKVSAEP